MENKSGMYACAYKKYTRKFLVLTFLLGCLFPSIKSGNNITNTETPNTEFLEIKNEIDRLRPKYEWQKVEITNSNAPVLAKFVNKYLQKFCAKTDAQLPSVCLYYNSKNYENYNYYWHEKSILLGSEILDVLCYSTDFEKYFAALLAHEFAHFKLNHNPSKLFAVIKNQEEAADKLAFTLIDNPKDLVIAHLFIFLTSMIAQQFEVYTLNENKLNALIAQTMEIFSTLSPGFGNFAQCSCWMSVYHLFCVAFEKTKFNTDLSIFFNNLALNLATVSNESHSNFNMDYLKFWIPRLKEFLKHPLEREAYPSPKQLSKWCQNILANQAA